MVALHAYSAAGDDTASALERLALEFDTRPVGAASLAFLFYGCGHDDAAILDFMAAHLPGTPLIGGTSSAGLLCSGRHRDGRSIGLLVVEDEPGFYGVAAASLGEDPSATARRLLLSALDNAGCPGELPDLVWVYQSPGREEQVVAGLRSVLEDSCPIIGGSAADDTVAGQWRLASTEGPLAEGLAVAVLFPSGGIAYAYQSGYRPTGTAGVVTRLAAAATPAAPESRRAAEVYNEWLAGLLDDRMATGGSILAQTTMHPLAVEAGRISGIPQYLLVHPDAIGEGGSLETFAEVALGARLELMTGSEALLIERAGKVALDAAARLPGGAESLAGGVLVYCAGCSMAVGDGMPAVAKAISRSFEARPYLGCFTFGELGQIVGRNRHGNLMISAIAFGR
ncbi:MAG: FIST N-terminal domain-containing protein [Tistlia sp.]